MRWAGSAFADAAAAARAGAVTGRAHGTPTSAAAAEAPLSGVALVLVPRSDELLAGLDRIKQRSRDSVAAYRAAIPEMRQLVENSVRSGAARTFTTTVDESGRFALADVPGGAWILIGRRAVHVDRSSKDIRKESGVYQPQPRLVGYDRVTVWLQLVAVEPGHEHAVELTDRNMWFEGVEETTAARRRPSIPAPNRRSAD
jgi:hypothetical protein